MLLENVTYGENVTINETEIRATYEYQTTEVIQVGSGDEKKFSVTPKTSRYEFVTEKTAPKLGIMLVGWGGNNGTTVTAGVLANKHKITWATKNNPKNTANYYGSLTQASTVRVGNFGGEECFMPINKLVPMVNPDDVVFGGWDISSMPLDKAMARGCVMDYDLQQQVAPLMRGEGEGAKTVYNNGVPLPAIMDLDFIAENQNARADNVIKGTKAEQVAQVRADLKSSRRTRVSTR